jgi:hypothetical protein
MLPSALGGLATAAATAAWSWNRQRDELTLQADVLAGTKDALTERDAVIDKVCPSLKLGAGSCSSLGRWRGVLDPGCGGLAVAAERGCAVEWAAAWCTKQSYHSGGVQPHHDCRQARLDGGTQSPPWDSSPRPAAGPPPSGTHHLTGADWLGGLCLLNLFNLLDGPRPRDGREHGLADTTGRRPNTARGGSSACGAQAHRTQDPSGATTTAAHAGARHARWCTATTTAAAAAGIRARERWRAATTTPPELQLRRRQAHAACACCPGRETQADTLGEAKSHRRPGKRLSPSCASELRSFRQSVPWDLRI